MGVSAAIISADLHATTVGLRATCVKDIVQMSARKLEDLELVGDEHIKYILSLDTVRLFGRLWPFGLWPVP